MRRILIFLGVFLAITNRNGLAQEQLLSQSEPPIQDQIQRVVGVLYQPGVDPRSNVAVVQEIQTLKDIVADKGEIVKQVAIFAAAPGEQQPMLANLILQSLDLPPSIVIRVLAPYLDANNTNLKSFVRDWFQAHDNAAAPGPGLPPLQQVNYEDYKDYVRGTLNPKREVPNAFVDYIFDRSPDRALLVFYYANRSKEPDVLLGEHLVSNAIWLQENDFADRFQKALPEVTAELTKLANHKDWWVRLYAAEIMRQHPELRQPAVVQQLATDSNPLVSEAAQSAK